MKVAIVGAGVSGLSCARELVKAGAEVVLFERDKKVGGRCATRTIGDYTFDTGATSIAPRGRAIEKVMLGELDRLHLVTVEKPIFVHHSLRVEAGDASHNRAERFCYSTGLAELPKLLAANLDIRLNTLIERFEKQDGTYTLFAGDQGFENFDRLVLAVPAPTANALLKGSRDQKSLDFVHYRPCLSVLLGYDEPLETPYHALVEPDQTHPLTWLSVESVKSPGRAPEGHSALVAQLSPAYSRLHFESEEALIIQSTCEHIGRLFGSEFRSPVVSQVKRWAYSLPENIAMFDSINPPGATVVVAGDGLLGGRIEFAFETGVMAAQRVLGQL
ncbi:MAG: FAD-dependent oxidoreductase [Fimbriimonadaceae bacterium]